MTEQEIVKFGMDFVATQPYVSAAIVMAVIAAATRVLYDMLMSVVTIVTAPFGLIKCIVVGFITMVVIVVRGYKTSTTVTELVGSAETEVVDDLGDIDKMIGELQKVLG